MPNYSKQQANEAVSHLAFILGSDADDAPEYFLHYSDEYGDAHFVPFQEAFDEVYGFLAAPPSDSQACGEVAISHLQRILGGITDEESPERFLFYTDEHGDDHYTPLEEAYSSAYAFLSSLPTQGTGYPL